MSDSSSPITVPTLIVTGGPLDGTTFEIDASPAARVLGSSSDADLQLLLGNVEAGHAQVRRTAQGLVLEDGNSTNGTYVNGEKIAEQVLKDGDRISLGPPGSKGSAKLIVRIPLGGAALVADAGPPGVAPVPDTRTLPFESIPETIALKHDEPLKLVEPDRPPAAEAPVVPPDPSPPPPPSMTPPPPPPPPTTPTVEAKRPAAKPDYLTEQPSIGGGERTREPLEVPAAPAPSRSARPAAAAAKSNRKRGPGLGVSPA
ncbi:MAG TPA: FHA domain-containing protein, partial [Vicinamibacteria bacterium]